MSRRKQIVLNEQKKTIDEGVKKLLKQCGIKPDLPAECYTPFAIGSNIQVNICN